MHHFVGHTANEVWRQAALAVREENADLNQPSRAGNTRELRNVLLFIENPRERWITYRLPAMNPAFAIAEVVWIISGRNDSAFLNFWNPILPRFQGQGETYHGAYGWRLRSAFGIDQIAQAYEALRSNPDTRQVVLQVWDPRLDLPLEAGRPRSEDIPCNICSMLKLREGRLEWTQVMRSNDLIRGFPHNVVQFTYLQELMAAWLGYEVGTYVHLSNSLHVYENQLHDLDSMGEEPAESNRECWTLGYSDTMEVFRTMATEMDRMRVSEDRTAILEAVKRGDLPEPARNMLLVVGSDAARRKGWFDIAQATIGYITNPQLIMLLRAWYHRKGFTPV